MYIMYICHIYIHSVHHNYISIELPHAFKELMNGKR